MNSRHFPKGWIQETYRISKLGIDKLINYIDHPALPVKLEVAKRIDPQYLPRMLKKRVPINLKHLIFQRIDPKLVPLGFRNSYRKWVVQATLEE